MIDILIINVPGTLTNLPLIAPALLKASIKKAGFTCKTVDYNLKFKHNNNFKENKSLAESYFLGTGEVPQNIKKLIDIFITEIVDEIIEINPKYLGISVFTYQNQTAAKLIAQELKLRSSTKIILGGQGIATGTLHGNLSFAENLLESKLIDFYIKSEGEQSLVELLKGNFDYPGINSSTFSQIKELDSLPFPDYDDYEFKLYQYPVLPILGSRGCVRACSFCDVHSHWEYRFRSGKNIADEVITNSKKYNIKKFSFSDSLINGSLKEHKIFCDILAKYNESAVNKITYKGQFIIRKSNQLDDLYWENLAKSGADDLYIGIETGSDAVRKHMNKRFTNEDIDYTLEKFKKYNITCNFLMIVGYPTETKDDFQQTLDMFTKYKNYQGSVITRVITGSTLGILPGTPLYDDSLHLNIELDNNENNWIAFNNIELTLEERIARTKKLVSHVRNLGFHVDDTGSLVLDILSKNINILNKRTKIKKLIKIKQSY